MSLYITHLRWLCGKQHLTDAGGWTGLPVKPVVHLNAGDPGLALQVVAWIARKGHGVARLLAFAAAAAVHGRPRVSAGGRHGTCETRKCTGCAHFSLAWISRREVAFSCAEMRLCGLCAVQCLHGVLYNLA